MVFDMQQHKGPSRVLCKLRSALPGAAPDAAPGRPASALKTRVLPRAVEALYPKNALPSALAERNRAANEALDCANRRDGFVGPGVLIQGQGRERYADYRFGRASRLGGNGCMTVAAYNALVSLGQYVPVPQLQFAVDTSRALALGGRLGGSPSFIAQFFAGRGYAVEKICFPARAQARDVLARSKTAVVLYCTGRSLHYVNVHYDSGGEALYRVDNLYSDGEAPAYFDFDNFFRNVPHMIAVYGID